MNFEDLRLSAYLDEAGDDPNDAAAVLNRNNIKHVCLRRAWGRDIFCMSDDACNLVRDSLKINNLTPVLLSSTIGDVFIQNIMDREKDLDRAIIICNFFKCPALQISLGSTPNDNIDNKYLYRWMNMIKDKCLHANIKPVFEINYNHYISSPVEIAQILKKFASWSILYDPAQLITKRKIQPFTKYWSLLRDRISYFDIRDYISGIGPRPPGHGNGQIDLTLNDAIVSGFGGWYCFEPGMGRRYNNINGKVAVFEYALNELKALFDRLDMGLIQIERHTKWYQQK